MNYNGATQSSLYISWTGPTSAYTTASISSNSGNITLSDKFKAGTYTFTIMDGGSTATCSTTVSATFSEPEEVMVFFDLSNFNGMNISTNGGNDGWIRVLILGGDESTMGATWLDGPRGTERTGLGAGIYRMEARDGKGCNATSSIMLIEPAGGR